MSGANPYPPTRFLLIRCRPFGTPALPGAGWLIYQGISIRFVMLYGNIR
jgi:hypothetical protein